MKKFLIIFGSFILFLISLGTMFKLMHWPGAGPLLVLGMFFFSVFFLPFFFIQRMIENRSGLSITTNIFGLVSSSLLFTGVLFKIMHWPGAALMIVFGTTLLVFPTIILYVIQQFKEYDRKFREFWRTVVLAVLVCVFLVFWGTNVSRNILVSYLKVEDATIETNKNLEETNEFILDEVKERYSEDSSYLDAAENIHSRTVQMLQEIEDIKTELIQRVERNPEPLEDHWQINQKDNYDIPTYYLGTADSEKGLELYNSLNNYKMELKEEMKELTFLTDNVVDSLGDFGIRTELRQEMLDEYELSWNEGMFQHQVVVGALALLTSIQNEALNAEFKCLKAILMNGRKFKIQMQLNIKDGNSDGGLIQIKKNGIAEANVKSDGMKHQLVLDFNSSYLIECSKSSCATKIIFFDTHIPKGREKEEFADFFITVELENESEKETVSSSIPVGGVRYDNLSGDFRKVKG